MKGDSSLDENIIIQALLRECCKEEPTYKISALEATGDILSSLEVDKFEEIYKIVEKILQKDPSEGIKDDSERASSEEMAHRREVNIKLQETIYITLGKIWPASNEVTQEKYGKMFVNHCVTRLPLLIRTVQVSVLTALCNYVDKLSILSEESSSDETRNELSVIVDEILKAGRHTLGMILLVFLLLT